MKPWATNGWNGSARHNPPYLECLGAHWEGRYASASEVVHDALRLLDAEEQRRAAALETMRAEIRLWKGLQPRQQSGRRCRG